MKRVIKQLPTITIGELNNDSSIGILFNNNKYLIGCTGKIYHLNDPFNYKPMFVKVKELYSVQEVVSHMLNYTNDVFVFELETELLKWCND